MVRRKMVYRFRNLEATILVRPFRAKALGWGELGAGGSKKQDVFTKLLLHC